MKRKATKNHVCMCRNQKMLKTEEVREKLQNVKSRAYERTLTLAIRGRFCMVCEGGGIRHDYFPYNRWDRFLSAGFFLS